MRPATLRFERTHLGGKGVRLVKGLLSERLAIVQPQISDRKSRDGSDDRTASRAECGARGLRARNRAAAMPHHGEV
jgi:hypothetical protein